MANLKTFISEIIIAIIATGVISTVIIDQAHEALERIDEIDVTINDYLSEIDNEINLEREVHE